MTDPVRAPGESLERAGYLDTNLPAALGASGSLATLATSPVRPSVGGLALASPAIHHGPRGDVKRDP